MKKQTSNLGGKVVAKTKEKQPLTKKNKIIILVLSIVIALGVIAGVVMGILYGVGAFEKKVPTLHEKDAANGFKRYYVTGGTYPGTYAVMTINDGEKDYEIEILLMKDLAPITVNNFIQYVEEGFYDGTVIHRIVPDTYTFQGGGKTYQNGKYVSKSGTHDAIKGEFLKNLTAEPEDKYAYNILSHFAGTISMARTNNVNSATSEFFISWNNYPAWDGNYAAFGFIVDVEDVLAIKKMGETAQTDEDEQPKSPITITKIEIKEVE